MSIAFEEPEFNGEMGACQKQRLVDVLLRVMVPSPPSSPQHQLVPGDDTKRGSPGPLMEYSPSQIAHLFTFFARQMSRDKMVGETGFSIPPETFERVLDVLTTRCAPGGSNGELNGSRSGQ